MNEMYPIVDPHVHLRWNEQDTDWLGLALEQARGVRIGAMIEMPNTDPPLTTYAAIKVRRQMIQDLTRGRGPAVFQYIGITNNLSQVVDAAREAMDHPEEIAGIKVYWADSTGDMGIKDPEYQRMVWKAIISTGYTGVVAGHYEDETKYREKIPFDPTVPASHSYHQPPSAELTSVVTQHDNAASLGFRGTFYICHATDRRVVQFARNTNIGIGNDGIERRRGLYPMKRIVVEATWHHLFLNVGAYQMHGHEVKVNPPLRNENLQRGLLHMLNSLDYPDAIDLIATDHAPHDPEKKEGAKPASGIPGIPFWPKGIQMLKKLRVGNHKIAQMTRTRAVEIFPCLKLWWAERHAGQARLGELPVYDSPRCWRVYGVNPYEAYGGHEIEAEPQMAEHS